MVVLVIDQDYIFFLEREGQPPISAHLYCPMAPQIASQLMQSPAWHVHIHGRFREIQKLKPVRQSFRVRRINTSLAPRFEELLNARVPEALDHPLSVAHHASGGKGSLFLNAQYPKMDLVGIGMKSDVPIGHHSFTYSDQRSPNRILIEAHKGVSPQPPRLSF